MANRKWACRNCGRRGDESGPGFDHSRVTGHWVEFEKGPPSPFADLTDEEFMALPVEYVARYHADR